MGVDACCGVSDVRGEGKVWKPQVLNVGVPERLVDEGVEASTREHGHLRIGQVKHHPPDLCHFLCAERNGFFFYCQCYLLIYLFISILFSP